MPKFEIDSQKVTSDFVNNSRVINPEAFTGNLDLSSSYLEGADISPSLLTDPNADDRLNEIKAQNQNWVETIANNSIAAVVKTGGNIIGGVGYLSGLGNGIAQAIGRGIDENEDFRFDRNDFFESPLIHINEKIDEWVERELPNYQTHDEQNNPLVLRNFFGTVASTTTRDALPFFAAFMLEGIGLAKVMGSYAKIASLEKIAARATGEGIQEMGKAQSMIKKFWQTADQTTIRELMIAQESLVEAHHGSDVIKEENYKRLYDEAIGRGMSEQEAGEIAETKSEELANVGAGAIYALNSGILRMGNIEMKTLFKPAMGSRRPYEALKKSWGELKGIKEYASKAGKTILNADIAKESAEELLQGSGADAVLEKTKQLEEDESYGIGDFLTSGVNTLTGVVKRIGTTEGQLEALSSIVLTGGASIINKKRNNQQDRLKDSLRKQVLDSNVSEEYKQAISDLTTSQENGETILSDLGSTLVNKARTSLELNILTDAAEATSNSSLYGVVRNQQLANIALQHFEFGLGEELERKIDEVAKEEAKKLKESQKTKIFDYELDREITIEEHTANLKNKIKSFENIYNAIETKYGITNDALRTVLFNNSVQQNELSKKIKNYKPILGEEWLNHLKSTGKEESVYLKELEDRKEQLDKVKNDGILTTEEIQESINVNTLLNLYDNYQMIESDTSNSNQFVLDNQKRYKDKSTDIAFLNRLKEEFKKAINPETQQEIIDAKNIRDEAATGVDDLPTTQGGNKPLTREEIDKIQDPQAKKAAEITFAMGNLFSRVGQESANKIKDYADRIISGKETREQVIQGLPKSFVEGIDALLKVNGISTPVVNNDKYDIVEDKKQGFTILKNGEYIYDGNGQVEWFKNKKEASDKLAILEGKKVEPLPVQTGDKFSLVGTDYFNQVRTTKNSPLENLAVRTKLLISDNLKNKIRVRINRDFNKSTKPDGELVKTNENTANVVVYDNKGLNTVDMTVEYLDENGKWQDYGSLNTINRLRTPDGKPIRLNTLTYKQFTDLFNYKHADAKKAALEFSEDDFKSLQEQEAKFELFEKALVDKFKNEGLKEFVVDPSAYGVYTSFYFDTTPTNLSDVIKNAETLGIKVNIIYSGKDSTGKVRDRDIPEYFLDNGFGIKNKTYAEIIYPNGQTVWKIVYPIKRDPSLEKEVSSLLSELAKKIKDIPKKDLNKSELEKEIGNINNKIFMLNSERKYVNLRVFETATSFAIKVNIGNEEGNKKSVTLWGKGSKFKNANLNTHFSFDNLSSIINDSGLVTLTKDSFVSNVNSNNINPEELLISYSGITSANLKIEPVLSNIPETIKTEEAKEEAKEESKEETTTKTGKSLDEELDAEREDLAEREEAPFSRFVNTFEVLSNEEQKALQSKGINSEMYNNSSNEIKKQLLFQAINC